MRLERACSVWLAWALAAAPLLAQDRPAKLPADVARVADLADRDSQVQPMLEEFLAKFGARLTGSTSLRKAADWAKEKFASFGLDAKVENWGEWEVGFDRGRLSGKIVAPVERAIDVGTNAWTPGTEGPARGPVRPLPAEAAEVEKAKAKYHGAWILLPAGKRLGPANPGTVEGALQEAGILGFVGTEGGELIHTGGSQNVRWESLPKRVSARIQGAVLKEIQGWLGEGKDVALELDLENRFVKGPVPLPNVLADLKGSEKPDEYVIVGGHIDSWDGAQGATDNGTGVATTLEAARLLSKLGVKPRRTIRFMLWSGEEQGLLGSRAWIKANPEALPKISCVLVHDEGTNYVAGIVVPKPLESILEPALAPLASLDPKYPFEFARRDGLPVGIGSDHDSFLGAGVPGFFWIQKGEVNYNRGHHTQYDTASIVRHDYQRHSAKAIAIAAMRLADLPDLLPRQNVISMGGGRGARGPGGRRLGIMPAEADKGVGVEEVTEGGLAARAGLKAGDVIVKIGDTAVADLDAMREAIQKSPPKTTVTVRRAGKNLVLPVEWPEDRRPDSRPSSAPAR